jgi:glycosyltransferase involved in cell wall biosynthesis
MDSGSTEKRDFAFVIPVYNHPQYVVQVIQGVQKHGFPVIVVNDGSTDETAASLEKIPGIQVLSHLINQGKGAAILSGFREAEKIADRVIIIDADGQHDPVDAAELMDLALHNPGAIIIGTREKMKEQLAPWTSRFGKQFSNFGVFAVSGMWLKDSQSGFRIYPLPESLDLRVTTRRFQFEVEILVKARWQGIPVLEKPISVKYKKEIRWVSHFRPLIDFLHIVATLCRLFAQRILIPSALRRRMYVRR